MKRNVKNGVYIRNGVENSFNFYTNLRATDKIKFVNTVVDTLVGDNYNFIIRDLIFDFEIVDVFTDVDISDIANANDAISAIEDFLDETNIVEIVKANAQDIIEELSNAVNDGLEYRTGIHKNPITESLGHLLNTLDKKVAGIDTDNVMKMAQVIGNMTGELTPEKMIEAYAKSDVFKEKYEKLIADRENHNAKIDGIITDAKTTKGRKRTTTK